MSKVIQKSSFKLLFFVLFIIFSLFFAGFTTRLLFAQTETFTFVSPADESTVSDVVPISGRASVPVVNVDYEVFDSTGQSVFFTPGTEGSFELWSFRWDSTVHLDDVYQIIAHITPHPETGDPFDSDPLTLIVDNQTDPPSISITSPNQGEVIINDDNVLLEAVVANGSVSSLTFQISGPDSITLSGQIDEANSDYWRAYWPATDYQNGNYQIFAQGLVDGIFINSPPVDVTVENTININIDILQPTPGEIISGIYTFKAQADQPVDSLDSLSFILDNDIINLPLGPAVFNAISDLWELTYDTNQVADGNYYLIAEAIFGAQFGSTQTSIAIRNQPATPQCSDRRDNDGDGLVDYPADPGCDNTTDDDESDDPPPPPSGSCSDGVDNDDDGYIDYPADPGCIDSNDDENEYNPPPPPPTYQCSDGTDNDGDGWIDLDDPGCESQTDDDESNPPIPPLDFPSRCSDTIDNDGDGLVDMNDPGCESLADDSEYNEPELLEPTYRCSDDIDNDNDGLVDMADPGCSDPTDDTEFNLPLPPPPLETEPEPEIPDECVIAGILDRDACGRFLFNRYNEPIEQLPGEELPEACQQAGITNQEECGELLKNIFMPDECRLANISLVEDCEIYLAGLHLPQECLGANIIDNKECQDFLEKQYLDPECKQAQITNKEECQDYILEKYATDVECVGLDPLTCDRVLRERHLSELISSQKRLEKVEEVISPYIGKSITLQETKVEEVKDKVKLEHLVPIVLKKETPITLLPSIKQIILNEQDEIVQIFSAIITFDDDGDGVPNEIERRLGTNPFSADTDNDGFDDGDELQNNFNPLGAGELAVELAPVEEAIINQVTFEQPKVTGEISHQLIVEEVEDIAVEEDDITVQKVSGLAFPHSVVMLYIYSELPVVVTVNTDQYGNWAYTLQQSLLDGKHEIYVTVNDNTGRIVAKSNPLSFIIREAKAVSPQEFVAIQRQVRDDLAGRQIQLYILFAVILTIGGIVLFIYFIKMRDKNSKGKTEGGLINEGTDKT